MEPPLLLNHSHSVEAGSIQSEMTTRLSHYHPLFLNYNTLFYGILEESVRGTINEATIKLFNRTHGRRGAYKALMAQNAGKDKWIFVLLYAKLYINSRKWNGNTNFTVQNHVERFCADYVDIETAAIHVPGQIPNQRT